MENQKKLFSFYVDTSIWNKLNQLAKQDNRSLNNFCLIIFNKFLSQKN